MAAETAFIRHRRARHGGLQAGNRTRMPLRRLAILQMGVVVLDQAIELVAAGLQNPGEIQRDVRGMIVVAVSELIRPVTELLPFVGAFFGYFDRVFAHNSHQSVRLSAQHSSGIGVLACAYDAPSWIAVDTFL